MNKPLSKEWELLFWGFYVLPETLNEILNKLSEPLSLISSHQL